MTPRVLRPLMLFGALLGAPAAAQAQQTRDLGLPPPFDNPALPPAQNPNLPPPTGQRYLPGTGGPFANPDRPVLPPQRARRALGLDGYRADIRASQPGGKPGGIERLSQIAPYLRACWSPPAGFRPATRLDATLRFSLTKGGDLVGQPRVTYVNALASKAQRAALVDSMTTALKRCAPLPLSQGLGAAIAGRPMSVRFIIDAPSTGV